jgi:predicted Fe-Mo cluster-binding NifX family protein
MRVAIPTIENGDLEGALSPHFGRGGFFVLVDLEGSTIREVRTVANPFFGNHRPNQIPAFVAAQEANAILAGGMGRRAITNFEALGVEVATGGRGTARQVLEAYLSGELQGAAPCRGDGHRGCGDREGGG